MNARLWHAEVNLNGHVLLRIDGLLSVCFVALRAAFAGFPPGFPGPMDHLDVVLKPL